MKSFKLKENQIYKDFHQEMNALYPLISNLIFQFP